MDTQELVNAIFTARKRRAVHPSGEFDGAGRWYPSDNERCACCADVRRPSRAYPYSYLTHCRTRKHVQHLVNSLLGTDGEGLLFAQAGYGESEMPKPERACPDGIAYKVLAIDDRGRLCSVYDGSFWGIGRERKDRARQGHHGGLYVYETVQGALGAQFPDTSAMLTAPRVMVRCRVAGTYTRYGSKLAFSRVTVENIEKIL